MKTFNSKSVLACSIIVTGCSSTIPLEEREQVRIDIDTKSQALIETLAQTHPEIEAQVAQSKGYATTFMYNVKVPVVGKGQGIGAVYNEADNSTTYVDVNRYDIGAGLTMGGYQSLTIFTDADELERFSSGTRERFLSTDVNFGREGSYTPSTYMLNDDKSTTYLYYESNVTAVSSARMMSVSVNEELTETGLGNYRVASFEEKPLEDTPAPKWDSPLPLFAQDVIDKGFSLPNPFGISIIYSETRQNMTISDLSAGFSGLTGGQTRPIEFVTFDNNYSHSETPQLKVDAWVFPFLNVFATVGKVNGMAHVEFELDGTTLVNNADIKCSGLIQNHCVHLRGSRLTCL